MYYTHPGCRTSIFGENHTYCIGDFTVCVLMQFYLYDAVQVSVDVYLCLLMQFYLYDAVQVSVDV